MVLGAWYLVLGAWCLVLGAWCLVHGMDVGLGKPNILLESRLLPLQLQLPKIGLLNLITTSKTPHGQWQPKVACNCRR